MDNNKTDNYFRERLGNFEQSPPETGWDNIARKLADRRKKRVFMLVFRIAAGMAILLSTGLGVYLISKQNNAVNDGALQERMADNSMKQPGTITPNSEDTSLQKITGNSNEMLISQRETGNAASSGESDFSATESLSTNYRGEEPAGSAVAVTDIIQSTAVPYDNPKLLARVEGRLITTVNRSINDVHSPQTRQLTAEESAALLLADYYDNQELNNELKNTKWSVGSEVAPLYSYRSIKSEQYNAAALDNLNDSESGILAYAGGVQVSYNAGKRFSVQSGVYYSRYGQQKNQVEQVSDVSNSGNYKYVGVVNSTGNITGVVNSSRQEVASDFLNLGSGMKSAEVYPLVQGDVENITFNQLFDYFEVPLIMKYKVIDRKIDFSFSGGLVTNFLIGNTVNMVEDGESTRITETEGINRVNYQGSVGMGLEYPVSPSFALTLEPRFRYYINPIGSSSAINVRPFSFGFFAGVNYRF